MLAHGKVMWPQQTKTETKINKAEFKQGDESEQSRTHTQPDQNSDWWTIFKYFQIF